MDNKQDQANCSTAVSSHSKMIYLPLLLNNRREKSPIPSPFPALVPVIILQCKGEKLESGAVAIIVLSKSDPLCLSVRLGFSGHACGFSECWAENWIIVRVSPLSLTCCSVLGQTPPAIQLSLSHREPKGKSCSKACFLPSESPNPMSAVTAFGEKMKTGLSKPNGAAEFHKTFTLMDPTAGSFV